MALNNGLVAILSLCVVGGCSSADSKQPTGSEANGAANGSSGSSGSTGTSSGNGSSGDGTGSSGGDTGGGSSSGSSTPPPVGLMTGSADGGSPTTAQDCDTTVTSMDLTADLVVPAGKTFCVGPGVTVTAKANITVQVAGVLSIAGTAASPAKFVGGGAPKSWNGIVIASGGSLQAVYANVGDANYAIHAMPGSTFNIDHGDLGTSFKTAVLESSGKIDHTYFRASVPDSISIASEVTIDDPNGTMTILSASPLVSNSSFIGASPFTDLVRIGGASSPVFDHDLMQNAHCGFHDYGATNNSPKVTNSIISGMSYGVMAYTTQPVFESTVFMGNATDVGLCSGATTANQPQLKGDYFSSGKPVLDQGCVQIGTAATGSVSTTIAGAGPVGL